MRPVFGTDGAAAGPSPGPACWRWPTTFGTDVVTEPGIAAEREAFVDDHLEHATPTDEARQEQATA